MVAVLLVAFALEQQLPPRLQPSARLTIGALRVYQATASRWIGRFGGRCRFQPTCSRFAVGAIEKGGTARGVARAAWRVARCAPWTPMGTIDPP